jgi:hypothetical protein
MNKRVANATVAFATQYIVAKGLNSKPRACANRACVNDYAVPSNLSFVFILYNFY